MKEINYTIPEYAFDELCNMLECIEDMALDYWKKTRRNMMLHSCDVRAAMHYIKERAASAREYICDQVADQVQYTLSDETIRMLEEAEKNNDFVYAAPNDDGTWTILDPSVWNKKADEEE